MLWVFVLLLIPAMSGVGVLIGAIWANVYRVSLIEGLKLAFGDVHSVLGTLPWIVLGLHVCYVLSVHIANRSKPGHSSRASWMAAWNSAGLTYFLAGSMAVIDKAFGQPSPVSLRVYAYGLPLFAAWAIWVFMLPLMRAGSDRSDQGRSKGG